MSATHGARPDPDVLLRRVEDEHASAARGRLRIYFGFSAGVGKTFAMLQAARRLQAQGLELVVGVVETHGRSETAALLEGLPTLPAAKLQWRDRALDEFDLDGALAREPLLILIDELAHSNVPGSRHAKRWQDVDELLGAGFDVFTTLNVQHLESLNDVVGGITGIRVNETLPDTFFDRADEVVLVDVAADELLARLREGKVYAPAQAERAASNFFRKGNLMALRELALRRTADRVEDDVQAYRVEQSIAKVWKTEAALLCCVGPRAGGDHLVRSAARLAAQLNVEWHAVYVETATLQRLPARERERILRVLEAARELGATTVVLAGGQAADVLVDYARTHNVSRIVVGRSRPTMGFIPLGRTFGQQIAALAADVDLIVLGGELGEPRREASSGEAPDYPRAPRWPRYVAAVLTSLAPIVIATPLTEYFDPANIIMVFLLAVVLVAVRWGRGPAALAAFVTVAGFDYFFVSPRYSFAVSDAQYLLTFAVMLIVGLTVGQLTSGFRFQARVASQRDARSLALYEFARELSKALETAQVIEIAEQTVARQFGAHATVLAPDDDGRIVAPVPGDGAPEPGAAQWALDHGEPAGFGTDTLAGSPFLYLPLKAPTRTRGVIAVKPRSTRQLLIPEQRRQLETFAALIAISLERVHYVEVAQAATLRMESERLRNSLLSALSHDLRTPLSVQLGLSQSLGVSQPPLSPEQNELVQAMGVECRRMIALVDNLLDMARLQAGEVRLNRAWLPIEEVVGTALSAMRVPLGPRAIALDLPADLPLVEFDAVLIERVLVNLLENAAKYTAPDARVSLSAHVAGDELQVVVSDDGPGLPPMDAANLFEKFTRGTRESTTPGVGLGLAIARAIVEAHGGTIRAEDNPGGGSRFAFTLPLGTPPMPPDVEDLAVTDIKHEHESAGTSHTTAVGEATRGAQAPRSRHP